MPVAPGGQLPPVDVRVGRRLSPPGRGLLPVRKGECSVCGKRNVLRDVSFQWGGSMEMREW